MLGFGRRLVCTLGMTFLAVPTAFAHPGHGHGRGDFGLPHYLTEPEHLLVSVLLLLLVAVAGARLARTLRANPRTKS